MAEDEPTEQNSFQSQQGESTTDKARAAASAAGAALAALASGLVLRVQELVALADEAGHITVPVRSTCISELRYDTITGTMGVTFVDGAEYDYPSVSLYSFLAFVNARSKGEHYNTHFRGAAPTPWAGSTKQKRKIGRR